MIEELENRLRVMDLRLPKVGEHLGEERLCALVGGVDPSTAEAAHLAGCDECSDLLGALGEGLERLVIEAPELAPHVLPRPVAPRAHWGPWVLAVAGVGVTVAVLYALWPRHPLAEGLASALALPQEQPTQLSTTLAPSSPSTREVPVALELVAAEVVEVQEEGPDPVESAPVPRVEPRPLRPIAVEGPDVRLNLRGPKPIERMAVDGPSRGYGFLRLGSRPQAQVYVDGEFFGWTPLLDRPLPEGPHDVRLVYESPLAEVAEERFRVVIEPEKVWRALRDNRKRE